MAITRDVDDADHIQVRVNGAQSAGIISALHFSGADAPPENSPRPWEVPETDARGPLARRRGPSPGRRWRIRDGETCLAILEHNIPAVMNVLMWWQKPCTHTLFPYTPIGSLSSSVLGGHETFEIAQEVIIFIDLTVIKLRLIV